MVCGDAALGLFDSVSTLLHEEFNMVVRKPVFQNQRMCTIHRVLSGHAGS